MPPRTRSAGPAPAVKPLDFSRPRKAFPKPRRAAKPRYEFMDVEEDIRPLYKDAATQTLVDMTDFEPQTTTYIHSDSTPAAITLTTVVSNAQVADSTPSPANIVITPVSPDLTHVAVHTPSKRRIEAVDEPETTPSKRHAPTQADSLRRVLFPPKKATTAQAVAENTETTASTSNETSAATSTLFGKVWGGMKSWISPQKPTQEATPPQPIQKRYPQSAPAVHLRPANYERVRTHRRLDQDAQPQESRAQLETRLKSPYLRRRRAALLEKEANGQNTGSSDDEITVTSNEQRRLSPRNEESPVNQSPSPTPTREQEIYNQTTESSTNKRKRGTTFGLSYNDDEHSDEEPERPSKRFASVTDEEDEDTIVPLPRTPVRRQPNAGATPLKSALKSSRSTGKTVSFFNAGDSTRKTRPMYSNQGPAGHYSGGAFGLAGGLKVSEAPTTTFTPTTTSPDNSFSSTPSGFSPGTIQNTMDNTTAKLPAWLVNEGWVVDPKPIAFQPPICEPDDPKFNCWESEEGDLIYVKKREELPTTQTPVPTAPKMSHAELPSNAAVNTTPVDETATPTTNTEVSTNANNGQDNGNLSDADERANKLRQSAQKHAPKQPSRLSHVQQARSRSSSPPPTELRRIEDVQDVQDVPELTAQSSAESTPSPTISNAGYWMPPVDPNYAIKRPLDNTIKGADGMTDYEREYQYDEYFKGHFQKLLANLPTYEESGHCSKYMGDLIKRTVTEDDKQRDAEFHKKQMNEASQYIQACKEQGVKSNLVGGDLSEEEVWDRFRKSCWEEFGHWFDDAPWNQPKKQQEQQQTDQQEEL